MSMPGLFREDWNLLWECHGTLRGLWLQKAWSLTHFHTPALTGCMRAAVYAYAINDHIEWNHNGWKGANNDWYLELVSGLICFHLGKVQTTRALIVLQVHKIRTKDKQFGCITRDMPAFIIRKRDGTTMLKNLKTKKSFLPKWYLTAS